MVDKNHCMMNMEDEDEYCDFYDFTKAYKDHPLLIKGPAPGDPIQEDPKAEDEEDSKPKKAEGKGEESEEWDDCDVESMGSAEKEEDTEKEFQIVDESQEFTEVSKPTQSSKSF